MHLTNAAENLGRIETPDRLADILDQEVKRARDRKTGVIKRGEKSTDEELSNIQEANAIAQRLIQERLSITACFRMEIVETSLRVEIVPETDKGGFCKLHYDGSDPNFSNGLWVPDFDTPNHTGDNKLNIGTLRLTRPFEVPDEVCEEMPFSRALHEWVREHGDKKIHKRMRRVAPGNLFIHGIRDTHMREPYVLPQGHSFGIRPGFSLRLRRA